MIIINLILGFPNPLYTRNKVFDSINIITLSMLAMLIMIEWRITRMDSTLMINTLIHVVRLDCNYDWRQ